MSFAPVYSAAAHTLILGTYPSPKSRETGLYYGHAQNRFWPLLAQLLHTDVPQTVEQKKALICSHDLALWDTLASCTITGAADASIKNPVPNEIAALCAQLPVRQVLCNGAAAYRLCRQFHTLQIPVFQLPSTSPANAAWSMERLLGAWGGFFSAGINRP